MEQVQKDRKFERRWEKVGEKVGKVRVADSTCVVHSLTVEVLDVDVLVHYDIGKRGIRTTATACGL